MSGSMDPLAQTAAQREHQLAQAAQLFHTLVHAPESSWRVVSLPSSSESRVATHSRVNSTRSFESDSASRTNQRNNDVAGSYSSTPGQSSDRHATTPLDSTTEPFKILPIDSPSLVAIHKRPHPTKGPDVFRVVVKVPFSGALNVSGALASANAHLEGFRAAFATSDVRAEWDALVDSSELIEMPTPDVRVTKTNFRLGWPTSPRDAITVSRTLLDSHSQKLVDITTSLPAQPDSPAYLRPAPPYVRSHVHLAAWVLELPQSYDAQPISKDQQFIHVTAYWCWTLKGVWLGLPAGGLANHLGSTVCRLVEYVRERGDAIPIISDFGHAVDVEHTTFDPSRDTLAVDYSVLPDSSPTEAGSARQSGETTDSADQPQQMDVSPDRMLQLMLSTREGWNVKVRVRGSGHGRGLSGSGGSQHGSVPSSRFPQWRLVARRSPHHTAGVEVTILHDRLAAQEDVARVSIQVQRVAASRDIRLNGELIPVWPVNPLNALSTTIHDGKEPSSNESIRSGRSGRSATSDTIKGGKQLALSVVCPNVPWIAADLLAHAQPQGWVSLREPGQAFASVFDDADKLQSLSFEGDSLTKAGAQGPPTNAPNSGANSNAIDALIRRNYIYFISLLQEPDAKWKPVSDSRGVTITQLDSIDPTLIVYRAEATFVGIGVWDLFATISSPGAQSVWDKTHESSTLLADINDLSSLWQSKTKASWPVSARDSVTVCTSYKSPASVHIFSFSTDDRHLFPTIPASDSGVIRTQVDLRGWSVESLSPTTCHVTLLEQSDPKGWTSKSSTPTAMTSAVAGVGEHAIKFGAPPAVTRLLGARVKDMRYEHERATFRLSYELSSSSSPADSPNVECELRCDLESWSPNLDLVIDPPPIEISCLRRHKLSQGGGGLWITIEHVPASLEDDAAKISVRRGPAWGSGKARGVVMVNGANIHVDIDELEDDRVKELYRRKRSRPRHVPLDLTSPAFNAPRGQRGSPALDSASMVDTPLNLSRSTTPAGVDSAEQAPDTVSTVDSLRAPSRLPPPRTALRDSMTGPLDVLFLLRRLYAERSPDPSVTPAGWALVSERNGLHVRRKYMQSISTNVAIQRADKVVQGLAAEEILQAVQSLAVRRKLDERMEAAVPLQSYGHGAGVYWATTKPSFPFRGRAFCVSHLTARTASSAQVNNLAKAQTLPTHRYADQISLEDLPSENGLGTSHVTGSSPGKPIAYFYAAASSSWESIARASGLDPSPTEKEDGTSVQTSGGKLNPTSLPVGRVLIDGWILETVDPYMSTSHAIPSTRLTHVMAIDFGGSVPSSVNTSWNAALPKTINAIEAYLKGSSPNPGAGPSVDIPPSSVVVLGDGRDEDPDLPWSLTLPPGAENRTLLFQDFDPDTKKFEARSLIRVPPLPNAATPASGTRDPTHFATVRETKRPNARPDRRALSFSAFNEDFGPVVDPNRSPSKTNGSAQRPLSTTLPSHSSDNSLVTKAAIQRPRPSSIQDAPDPSSPSSLSNAIGEVRRAVSFNKREGHKRSREDIVLEVTVELGHYPRGYIIQAEAVRVPITHSAPSATPEQPGTEFKASLTRASSVANSLSEAEADVSITKAVEPSVAGQSDDTAGAITPRPVSGLAEKKVEPPSSTPLDLDADWSKSAQVPLEAAVYDLPPSALLAATLDSQNRPRRHLVRIYLASDDSPISLSTQETEGEESNWTHALLTCAIAPRTTTSGDTASFAQQDEDSDQELDLFAVDGEKPPPLVRFNNQPIDVVHVNKTSALLQRENSDLDAVPVLCKLNKVSDTLAGAEEKSYVPTLYDAPLAAHMDLIALPESAEEQAKADKKEAQLAIELDKNKDADEVGGDNASEATKAEDMSTNTLTVGRKESQATDVTSNGQVASSPSPIISLLTNSPLSRFGQSISSDSNSTSKDTNQGGRRASRVSGSSGTDGGSPSQWGRFCQRQVSLGTVILVALVFFLFGSFLRSLQTPADYIVLPQGMPESMDHARDTSTIAWELRRSLTPDERRDALTRDFASEIRKMLGQEPNQLEHSPTAWKAAGQLPEGVAVAQREVKRVLQINRIFGGWDMIVAFARD